jgi:nucleotide-binding universal stress UspA family protein
MATIKQVLVAVDESDRSQSVVQKALEMARAFDAKILLLYVRPKIQDFIGHPYYQKILDKYMLQADLVVEPHKQTLEESDVEYEVLILEGEPAEMIQEASVIEKCDLVVMGTRGLSNIQGMALGSVSHKVLHGATCMVLLVP